MKMSLFELVEQTKGLSDGEIEDKVNELLVELKKEGSKDHGHDLSYPAAFGGLSSYFSLLLQAYQKKSSRCNDLQREVLELENKLAQYENK